MKLKPCPFCGGTRIKTRRYSEVMSCPPSPLDVFKECDDCRACGPFGVRPTSAGARWNQRASDPDPMIDMATSQGGATPTSAARP
jgi:hypothetical protein